MRQRRRRGPGGPRQEAGRPPALLAWVLCGLTVAGIGLILWLLRLLTGTDAGDRTPNAAGIPLGVAAVSASTVGALLARRRPRHSVGWLLLALGLAMVVSGAAWEYVDYGLIVRPGSLPGAAYLAGFSQLSFLIWLSLAGFVLLLTPTGSLPTGRGWRWWARIAALAPAVAVVASMLSPDPLAPDYLGNPLAAPALAGPLLVAGAAALAVVLASLFVAAWAMVRRFRRARGVERQQLRWLAFAAVLGLLAFLAGAVAAYRGLDRLVLAAVGTCVALLPLATGAAILRYRLYDLDRIISRTLAYGLLTVLLGGAYAAVVLGGGQLLGQGRNLLVAGATLTLAAAFQPARRRVQAAVDRRFNRHRFDSAQTIAAFSARLRQQVDLETLTAELLAVVDQTMEPTSASLTLLRRRPPSA